MNVLGPNRVLLDAVLRRCVQVVMLVALACGGREAQPVTAAKVVPAGAVRARHVGFAGTQLAIPGGLAAPVTVTPALPPGLAMDPAGAISGIPVAPSDATYRLRHAGGERVLSIAVIAAPRDGDRFVAPAGDDAAAGTRDKPLRTIRRALDGISPGATVFLRDGVYAEDVSLRDVHGEPDRPITLRSLPGERAMIAGELARITWTRATGGASGEWISAETFEHTGPESTNRGAFADRLPYTRLLTYSRLEDLRAVNQRWAVGDESVPGTDTKDGRRVPWTYFGPGIWHDAETGKVHLRLAPTTNGLAGVVDYTGPTDPAQVPLQISARTSTPLAITKSSHVALRDLVIRGGGDDTVKLERAERVVFDHVDIDAASVGLAIYHSRGVTFRHGRIDGGIPPWSFRSDFKANYVMTLPDGTTAPNNLVRKTSRGLMFVGAGNHELEFAHCELENGHDIYFGGIDSALHHCRIRNIHDEGLFISHNRDIANLRIHDNVFERVLSGISGIGKQKSGARYLYRNIFDLREPTLGYRPGASKSPSVWRHGGMFKGRVSSAPFFFYQNTILVRPEKAGQPALLHYRTLTTDSAATWFLNNIVVVSGKEPAPFADHPDDDLGVDADGRKLVYSEGNTWIRIGRSRQPLFTCFSPRDRRKCANRGYASLDEVRALGREQKSRSAEIHGFARLGRLDAAARTDDLRPGKDSPARGTAIELPADLPGTRGRDAGALEADAPPLHVGVDGRFAY
jgi:hypothetical protein